MNEDYDPNEDIIISFQKKQDARHRLRELAQGERANDPTMILATIIGLEIYTEYQKAIKKSESTKNYWKKMTERPLGKNS